MAGMNHELRFEVMEEIVIDLNTFHNKYGEGIKKRDFVRAILLLGLDNFKENINKGLFPMYIYQPNKCIKIKLERKHGKMDKN